MPISATITSGRLRSYAERASLTEAAVTTSPPSLSSKTLKRSRVSVSSSTIRMLMPLSATPIMTLFRQLLPEDYLQDIVFGRVPSQAIFSVRPAARSEHATSTALLTASPLFVPAADPHEVLFFFNKTATTEIYTLSLPTNT